MNPQQQVDLLKSNFHKCISRMGVSTESNYSILKVKKQNPNVVAKVDHKNVQRTKKLAPPNPVDKTVVMFFDSVENCKRIFKEEKNMLEIRDPVQPKAKPEVAQRPRKDERHSYCDIKEEFIDKNQYNPKFEFVQPTSPSFAFKKLAKPRPATAVAPQQVITHKSQQKKQKLRGVQPFDRQLSFNEPKTLLIGDKSLRGYDANENRFVTAEQPCKRPQSSWHRQRGKNLNFANPQFCQNPSYNLQFTQTFERKDRHGVGLKFQVQRNQITATQNYIKEQQGAAVDVAIEGLEQKLVSGLGHITRAVGNVTFDRMKPRDNKMYYISEHSNLRVNDERLAKRHTKSFAMFDHKIVTDDDRPAASEHGNIWDSSRFKSPINYTTLQQMVDFSLAQSTQVKAVGDEALASLQKLREEQQVVRQVEESQKEIARKFQIH